MAESRAGVALLETWFSDYALFHETPPAGHDKQILSEWRLKRVAIWPGFRNVCRHLAEYVDGLVDPSLDSAPLWFLSGCAGYFGVPSESWTAAWVLCNKARSRVGTLQEAAEAVVGARRTQTAAELPPENPSPWVPAGTLWRDHFTTAKKLAKFRKRHPEMFRNPSKFKLEVHAGLWASYWAGRDRAGFGTLSGDLSSVADDPAVQGDALEAAAQRVASLRQKKRGGK